MLNHSRIAKAVLATLSLFLAATPGHTQATTGTATQGLRIGVFGMGSYVRPEYGGAKKNAGATLGADFDVRSFMGIFKPGLEIRATASGGNASDQYAYVGGPRVIIGQGRIQPYADFLVGYGQIFFVNAVDPFYRQDHNKIYVYGGGADFLVSRSWALKVDVQSQRWQLSHLAPPFHPLAVSAGLRYQLHFRNSHSPD